MAGYAKIWTDIFYDPWFCGLSCVERGAWLQLIVGAKAGSDTGKLGVRSGGSLGSAWGCDGKTSRKILGKFLEDGKVKVQNLPNGALEITILNYHYYQQDRKPEHKERTKEKSGKKSGKFPLNKIREDKINKIREDNIIKAITVNGSEYKLVNLFITPEQYLDVKSKYPNVHNPDEEFMMADMRRPDYPSRSKTDPHRGDTAFLVTWFKNSLKFNKGNKNGNNSGIKPEPGKYDHLC